MVSNTVIAGMIVQLVITVLVPIIALVYFRKKYNISFKIVLIGLIIFIGFSQIFLPPLHMFVLSKEVTRHLLENPFIYATYSSLTTAIFEGAGRFVAFYFILKEYRKYEDGLAYGIGHGGIESILIGGFASVQSLAFAFAINNGSMADLIEQQPALGAVQDALVNAKASFFAVASVESIMTFILQIAFSLLILYAVKHKQYIYVLYCVLFQAFGDFFSALYHKQVINLFVTEGITLVCTIIAIVIIRNMKQKLQES